MGKVLGGRETGTLRLAQDDGVETGGREVLPRDALNILGCNRGQAGEIALLIVGVGKDGEEIPQLAGLALDGLPPVNKITGEIRASPVEFCLGYRRVLVLKKLGEALFERGPNFLCSRAAARMNRPESAGV